MSDFRFGCPHCGQRILCNAGYRGQQMTCPTCQQTVTVPQIRPAAPLRPAPAPVEDKPSALAVASLVCSLGLSLGCVPGIICGHLAKARLRRDVFLTGNRMATAGLITSYVCLLFTLAFVAVGLFAVRPKEGRQITAKEQQARTATATQAQYVDEINIGDAASETAHSFKSRNSRTGTYGGKHWRDAISGGFFSYVMKVDSVQPMSLYCTYWGNDSSPGRVFDIQINGKVIATQKLDFNDPGHFFDVEYQIPRDLTRRRTEVTVTIQAHPGMSAGGVFGCRMLKR